MEIATGMMELLYWRDVKRSALVFTVGLVSLLCLTFFSIISILAYLSLLILTGTLTYSIYRHIIGAVQKTTDGGPYRALLKADVSLPSDRVHQLVDVLLVHVNTVVDKLRKLFLGERISSSLKFGFCMYLLTYVGAIFDGYTLLILIHVTLFTWPKIYDTNKTTIDRYLALARGKLHDISEKVYEKFPSLKKKME